MEPVPSIQELRRRFVEMVRGASIQGEQAALYGRGNGTTTVPYDTNWSYIRVFIGDTNTLAQATNPLGFTLADDDEIWVRPNREGHYEITRPRNLGLP
jgi:hypothetical protein